jgi:hypothetical protein
LLRREIEKMGQKRKKLSAPEEIHHLNADINRL